MINTLIKLVKQKKVELVVFAHNVYYNELVLFLPALCRKIGVLYCIVKDKTKLGLLIRKKICTAVALTKIEGSDCVTLTKLIEAIKTNFNNRAYEIKRQSGGGLLRSKLATQISNIESAKVKEMA